MHSPSAFSYWQTKFPVCLDFYVNFFSFFDRLINVNCSLRRWICLCSSVRQRKKAKKTKENKNNDEGKNK